MPSISSILSTLAANLGISRNTRESNAPGNSASKRSEAVTDVVQLSARALHAAKQTSPEATRQRASRDIPATTTLAKENQPAQSERDPRLIQKLQQTDRAVSAHEQAHIAVGGEVSIDTSPGRTPSESIAKAQSIRTAALAPAAPSPQDRAVAAVAASLKAEARQELDHQGAAATPFNAPPPAPPEKSDNLKIHLGLAAYQETSNILDQLKPPPSIRVAV